MLCLEQACGCHVVLGGALFERLNDFVDINKLRDLRLVNSEPTHRTVGELNVPLTGLFRLHVKGTPEKRVSVNTFFSKLQLISNRPNHLVLFSNKKAYVQAFLY